MPKKPEFPNELERVIFEELKLHKNAARVSGTRRGLMANELMSLKKVKKALDESKLDRPLDAALARLKSRDVIWYTRQIGWEARDGAEL
jgi:hypothetical protein